MGRPASQTGSYRIAELVEGQCRFACTPHATRPDAHRFCGAPVAWKAGKPTAWCPEHLARVYDTLGRGPAGAGVADEEAPAQDARSATRPGSKLQPFVAEVDR